jgi:hypothetical protein
MGRRGGRGGGQQAGSGGVRPPLGAPPLGCDRAELRRVGGRLGDPKRKVGGEDQRVAESGVGASPLVSGPRRRRRGQRLDRRAVGVGVLGREP